MSWKWAADVQAVQAFNRLPQLLSADPATQDLLRRFIQSVAFKGDLQYLKLIDVEESSFAGKTPGAFVGLNDDGDQLTLINAEDQDNTFLALTDTPPSYAGETGKYVAVNTAEDGLEFVTAPAGAGGILGICVAQSGSSQQINDGDYQVVATLDTTVYDPDSWLDSANDKIVVPTEGVYVAIADVQVNVDASAAAGDIDFFFDVALYDSSDVFLGAANFGSIFHKTWDAGGGTEWGYDFQVVHALQDIVNGGLIPAGAYFRSEVSLTDIDGANGVDIVAHAMTVLWLK